MKDIIFTSRLSKWIIGMYWLILIFLVAIMVGVPLAEGMGFLNKLIFTSLFSLIILVFIFIMLRAYRMNFTVTQNQVIVSGIFRKNIINIPDIKSIQKAPIPFGFRLFGASFLGGWYFLPGIGKAWVTMGNFKDGVLISTKQNKHFVITPQNPLKFIELVKGRQR